MKYLSERESLLLAIALDIIDIVIYTVIDDKLIIISFPNY